MHDGAYTTLESAVGHYLTTSAALQSYSASQLQEDLRSSYLFELVAFHEALTDPAAGNLSGTIPTSVPSGFPVGD